MVVYGLGGNEEKKTGTKHHYSVHLINLWDFTKWMRWKKMVPVRDNSMKAIWFIKL